MKKIIIAVSMLSLLLTIPTVMAATTVDTTWNGGGSFGVTFVSGDDAHSGLSTSGALISGEFHAKDYDDNPYGYGVDTTEVSTKAHVVNGGWIEYVFTKDSNYVPMYGPAGQTSYTLIDSSGTGDFAWRSSGNYAALTNSNYGWQSNNQMQATGDHYIDHSLTISAGEGARIQVDAIGTTEVTDMCDGTWVSSYSFGKGCGCYTNANVNTVGSGVFDLYADADNQIVTDTGITVNGGSLNVHSTFTGGFNFANFALTGN